jgi:hypothetical protein
MKHKIKSLSEYLREEFYNPFDEDNPVETKPSHIADRGGLLRLRKEVFNINRVEYSKKQNGSYLVLARTQFAKGEIVEISPVIFVGPETKAVPRLKDYIFEIDKLKQIYGVVLGYGSLYTHSENPNITFAYNSKNRQMYFIAARTINAGEELTINYGKDYWNERSGFGAMAQQQPVQSDEVVVKGESNESSVQPNSENITNMSITKQFAQPNNKANPVVSGVALKTVGQQ